MTIILIITCCLSILLNRRLIRKIREYRTQIVLYRQRNEILMTANSVLKSRTISKFQTIEAIILEAEIEEDYETAAILRDLLKSKEGGFDEI